jgi:toxin ParE1/3/4
MAYRLHPRAEDDIYDIMIHIGGDNPAAALKWQADLYETFAMLGDFPGTGVLRTTLKRKLRLFPKGNYLIFYQIAARHVVILRVIHAARDWLKQIR